MMTFHIFQVFKKEYNCKIFLKIRIIDVHTTVYMHGGADKTFHPEKREESLLWSQVHTSLYLANFINV